METIFIIGIFLSLFLSFLLFTKKHKSLSDKLLAVWLFIIGIHLLSTFFNIQGYWDKYPHLIGITVPFPFLYGPLLYLYVIYSFKSDKRLRKIDYLHFAPTVLTYLYMFRFYFFYSVQEKILVDKGLVNDFGVFSSILLVAFIISGLTYTLLAYRNLNIHKHLIDTNFSFDERINLNWLRYSVWGIGAVFITAAIVIILRELLHIKFGFNADLIFYTMIVAFVFYIGFSGIRQQDIFSNSIIKDEKQLAKTKPESDYKKSGLKKDKAQTKHRQLIQLMYDDKPYLNPKLTLSELSRQLSISPNHLSQIINQHEQVNFHDFVNKYRVDEFIIRAKSNNNFSILAHALDSGFNSKSSFNIVFKKFKEMTPSKYMASLKQ